MKGTKKIMDKSFTSSFLEMGISNDMIRILKYNYAGIIITLRDSTIAFVNDAYSRILGVPPEKLLGRKLSQLEPNSVILRVMENGQEAIHVLDHVDSLNEMIFGSVFLLPSAETFVGAISVFTKFNEKMHGQNNHINHRYIESYLNTRLSLDTHLPPPFSKVIGQDRKFRLALFKASKASNADFPVLIIGESGTGKELIVRAIHECSRRREHPFIALNCASLTTTLVESELFGYERGAFTDAKREGKRGLFELANKGTLFFDEVSDFDLGIQAKILRVLEEKEFRRVGGEKNIPTDARIISATNKDLERMVLEGKFREDLYYRINTMTIQIPPLRERERDVKLLANHFLSIFSIQYKKEIELHDDFIEILYSHNWPGNVRELRNVIDFAANMVDTKWVTPKDLPSYLFFSNTKSSLSSKVKFSTEESARGQERSIYKDIMNQFERDLIEVALRKSRNRTEAIKMLGLSRRAFYLKLKRHSFV